MAARPAPRTPDDLVQACATRFARRHRAWIADPDAGATDTVRLTTAAPSAARASEDPTGTAEWIQRWREFEAGRDGHSAQVAWADRRLPGFGVVALPQRVEVCGDRAIAGIAGLAARWDQALSRVHQVVSLGPDPHALRSAAAASAPMWEKLTDPDMERLLAVCRWAIEHPTEGLRAREVAVPGVDTKWLESRTRVVELLVEAARAGREGSNPGSGLGLKRADLRIRMRLLDPRIDFPLRDVESPVDQLATLWTDSRGPRHLVVVENLTTFLALPDLPDTIAVFGRGFAVDAVAALPWALTARIVYWGDLDSHGFAILDRLRHHAPGATSVMMDVETFSAWRGFSVPDPTPTRTSPTRLTPGEFAALEALTIAGDLRVEQERIPWDWALARLRAAYD